MFVLDSAAVLLASGYGRVAPVWPANAAALAIMLRSPGPVRPVLLAAAAAACLTANLAIGDAFTTALAYAAFNASEMGVVLLLFGRRFDRSASVEPLPMFTRFAVAAAIASLGSAGLAAAFAAATGGTAVTIFSTWFLADVLGLMTITPLLLSLTGPGRHRALHAAMGRETALIAVATVAVAAALFVQPAVPLILISPLLLLTGLRMPVRETALTVLVVAAIGIVATMNGLGPIAHEMLGNARILGCNCSSPRPRR
ncbi:MAG: MASE1 domain-containing protein [Sphingomicrobium sp.]